jgi:CRISPR-associated protein Cmr5
MQTRDQKYALDAHERVVKVKNSKDIDDKSYGSMAHALPIMILRAGLAQALSFVEAKAKTDGKNEKRPKSLQTLLDDLQATLDRQEPLAQAARKAELPEYMLLTRQVMDALLWYKRFAQSVLGVDSSDEGSEEDK